MSTYHERECNRNRLDGFEDPHNSHTDKLYNSEYMNAEGLHMTQVDVVGLVFHGHEEQPNTLNKLEENKMYIGVIRKVSNRSHTHI